jgi:hypothetical protein
MARLLVRAAAGAASLGLEQARDQLRRMAEDGARLAGTPPGAAEGQGRPRLRHVLVGMAAEAPERAAAASSRLARRGRQLAAPVISAGSAVGRTAPARAVEERLSPLSNRWAGEVRRLSEVGRAEVAEGRRLVRAASSRATLQVTERALDQVATNEEIAALVRRESTSVAENTLEEVRGMSERADDVLDRRLRALLRRR